MRDASFCDKNAVMMGERSGMRRLQMEDPMIGTVEGALKKYLEEQLLIDFVDEIDEDTDLFQMGLMDSYNYIEAVRFVELEFNIRFTNEEILTDVVTSLSGLIAMVNNKIAMQV